MLEIGDFVGISTDLQINPNSISHTGHCKNVNTLSYMKHVQEVSQSDLQPVKIRLVHFLGMFQLWQLRIKVLKFLHWQSMEFPFLPISYNGQWFILFE